MHDIHSHNLQPEHWGEEHKKNWEPAYGKPYPRVTPASFDAVMTEAGVDVAVAEFVDLQHPSALPDEGDRSGQQSRVDRVVDGCLVAVEVHPPEATGTGRCQNWC